MTENSALVDRLFSRENVDRLKPQIISQIVNQRIDVLLQEAQQRQPIDFVEKFALRVPTDVSFPFLYLAGLQFGGSPLALGDLDYIHASRGV